jgi:hypothetical protein
MPEPTDEGFAAREKAQSRLFERLYVEGSGFSGEDTGNKGRQERRKADGVSFF